MIEILLKTTDSLEDQPVLFLNCLAFSLDPSPPCKTKQKPVVCKGLQGPSSPAVLLYEKKNLKSQKEQNVYKIIN